MTKRFFTLALILCFLTVTSVPAYSHSGGTDSRGCHAGTQPYHCHEPKDDDKGETALIILGVVAASLLVLWLLRPVFPMPQADLSDIQDGNGKLEWEWRF